MRIGTHLIASGAVTVSELQAEAAAAATRGLDSAWTNQQPGGWDPLGVLTAMTGRGD